MAGNREAFEDLIIERIEAIMPGSPNTQLWRDRFAQMSNAELDLFVRDLKDKKQRLAILDPNLSGKTRLSVKRNLELGKKWGHEFFQRIWINNGVDAPYLTPLRYLVIEWTLRRQAQLLTKKMSVPEDNKSIDDLTGQPTGKSKGSKISLPELNVLVSHGLIKSTAEMVKYRGGDVDGFNAMNAAIAKTGYARMETLDHLGTKVRSTETLSAYFTGMHLGNTLLK